MGVVAGGVEGRNGAERVLRRGVLWWAWGLTAILVKIRDFSLAEVIGGVI